MKRAQRVTRRLLAGFVFVLAVRSSGAADEPRVVFNRDIRPLLSDRCFACHGPDEHQRKADLRLDVRDEAVGHVLEPGDAAASELIKRLVSDDPELRMPPPKSGRKPLTEKEVALIRRWVDQGAAYQQHWAFIPPQRPAVPELDGDRWSRSPIDHFVLARLRGEQLEPSPETDRSTLIRRVSLDLTGLPPTPEDVDAFLNDSSPDAFEKVVDRLLDSEFYGEHMARYWLDAARFADTNGYQYDLEREQWVWRDWVINAFNSNMPFDQFTVEQIAGDLLPGATDQQKLATAFHRNHPITIEGGVIDEEYRTEYVVDRVVTTSTVWLGLTMTCGRCHDHKYDPVSQREFYQFFAYFNQVPERGLNGFDPKLNVDSPLRSAGISKLDAQLVQAEARFRDAAVRNADDLANWSRQITENVRNQWTVFVPETRVSQGGATLDVQDDQSLLATGRNPGTELYEFVFDCETPIYAIRLEALTHPSFTQNAAGRAANGNFVLTEFEVAATKPGTAEFQPVKIATAEADYSQLNYNIALAIDGNAAGQPGWAVDGNTKLENRLAVFKLAEPLRPDQAGQVRLRLHHNWGGSHSIGRMRFALAGQPVTDAPTDVVEIAKRPADERTPEQRDRLNEYLIERFGSEELKAAATERRHLRERRGSLSSFPATMVLSELATPRVTRILERGEYDKPRDEVTAGVPAIFPPLPDGVPNNRLGLARWMVMPNHPLTARVAVNRFWQRLFGTGIVKTSEDFGSQGDWPSHPELLDWLSVEFVASGWDVKTLLKEIVLSATYRQSSRVPETLQQRDPENRWLARGPRLRLDAEVIRDSALFASGLLAGQVGGPSVFPYHPPGLWQEINNRPGYSRTYQQDSGDKLYRRSLYTFWKRTLPPPSMAAFDAPEREFCIVRRSRTNTPLQAFVMLNDPQFVEAARHLAERTLTTAGPTDHERIDFAFLSVASRRPTAAERSIIASLLTQRLKQYRANPEEAAAVLHVGDSRVNESLAPAEFAAWTTIARALFNVSEFVTKP